jgi:hypothetical protein
MNDREHIVGQYVFVVSVDPNRSSHRKMAASDLGRTLVLADSTHK